jgi:hypothetical protein
MVDALSHFMIRWQFSGTRAGRLLATHGRTGGEGTVEERMRRTVHLAPSQMMHFGGRLPSQKPLYLSSESRLVKPTRQERRRRMNGRKASQAFTVSSGVFENSVASRAPRLLADNDPSWSVSPNADR